LAESAVESSAEVVVDLNEKEPIRVLHVDDETSLLRIAKQCLEMEGSFQVDTASSVDEALEKVKKGSYDAVVSDYQMPGKDGLELLKELREKGDSTPFIMFTGKGREEVAIKALNLGANQYLNKTGDPETVYTELAHSISEVARSARAVAERKKAEETARESEEKWRSLVEMAPDGMATVDTKGVFTSVNSAFLRLTGYKREDIVGKHFTKLQTIKPKDIPKYLKLMIPALRGELPPPFEYSYVRKDGAISWGEAHIGSFKKNGKTIGYQVIFKEITERKRVEAKLLESEERFRLLFENVPVGVSLMDAEGHVVAANDADCRFLGHTQKELVGTHFSKFTHPEDLKKDLELYRELMRGKRNTYTIEKRYLRKDGKVVWGRLSASSIRDDNKRPKYAIAIREEMPEENNAEKTLA
jgi:PAS domain S-box-containing protein